MTFRQMLSRLAWWKPLAANDEASPSLSGVWCLSHLVGLKNGRVKPQVEVAVSLPMRGTHLTLRRRATWGPEAAQDIAQDIREHLKGIAFELMDEQEVELRSVIHEQMVKDGTAVE